MPICWRTARSCWKVTAQACAPMNESTSSISAWRALAGATTDPRARNAWHACKMDRLEVSNLSLAFGGLPVLSQVSFQAQPGELLALIGPNGAGKTSLFNCISGLYSPRGSIRFRGQELVGRTPHQTAALGRARPFPHAELFAQMSVVDNILT